MESRIPIYVQAIRIRFMSILSIHCAQSIPYVKCPNVVVVFVVEPSASGNVEASVTGSVYHTISGRGTHPLGSVTPQSFPNMYQFKSKICMHKKHCTMHRSNFIMFLRVLLKNKFFSPEKHFLAKTSLSKAMGVSASWLIEKKKQSLIWSKKNSLDLSAHAGQLNKGRIWECRNFGVHVYWT